MAANGSERHGFGALLAVGGGSACPPRLVVLRWRGVLPVAPVAFIGKGIVFDTGGISIKPAQGMEAMRADMAGAAACAGAMLALARRDPPRRPSRCWRSPRTRPVPHPIAPAMSSAPPRAAPSR